MNAAIKAIAVGDDVAIIRATQLLFSKLGPAFIPMTKSVVQTLKAPPYDGTGIGELLDYLDEHATEDLDDATSVTAARWLLVSAAEVPSLEKLVLECVTEWPDGKLSTGKMLKIGVVGGLWLLLATTDVRLNDKDWEIHKIPLDISTVEIKAERPGVWFKMDVRSNREQPVVSAPHATQSAEKN